MRDIDNLIFNIIIGFIIGTLIVILLELKENNEIVENNTNDCTCTQCIEEVNS